MCLCKLVMTHDSLLIVRFVFFPTLTVVGLPVLRKPRVAFQFTICPKKVFLPASFSFFTSSGACLPSPKQKNPRRSGDKKDPLALRAARGSRTIFGSGLLSHMTLCSIIGDGELNFRVRNGVGCTLSSMATKEIWQIY